MTQPVRSFPFPFSIRGHKRRSQSCAICTLISCTIRQAQRCRCRVFLHFSYPAFCPLTSCTCPTVGYPPTFSPLRRISFYRLFSLFLFFPRFYTSHSIPLRLFNAGFRSRGSKVGIELKISPMENIRKWMNLDQSRCSDHSLSSNEHDNMSRIYECSQIREK